MALKLALIRTSAKGSRVQILTEYDLRDRLTTHLLGLEGRIFSRKDYGPRIAQHMSDALDTIEQDLKHESIRVTEDR